MNVQYIRSNEVEDIFSYLDENCETQYIKFPRTMEMNCEDVENYLQR